MSLENQIERLTAAIEKLNGNIERALAAPQAPETAAPQALETAAPQALEPVASSTSPASSFTQDDLRRLCMAKVKEDRAFKDTLKEFLSKSYGVVKTSDVPDDKVAEVYSRIEAGDL